MSSTYSPDLRIELIGTGDQAGVWGVACFEPGHYAAGMRGEVRVSAK